VEKKGGRIQKTMLSSRVADLIRYIVWYATSRDIKLTTVRLVKFVYLADVHFARRNAGETYTGLPWAFIYYGPYCGEVMREIDTLASERTICRESYESKFVDKEYSLFSCRDKGAELIAEHLPIVLLYPLQADIRRFGDDTQALLDYVYFETEPMEQVRKGDRLDFARVRPMKISPLRPLRRLTKEEKETAKSHIRSLVEQMTLARARQTQEQRSLASELYDDAYFEALAGMESEDLQPGMSGEARIELE